MTEGTLVHHEPMRLTPDTLNFLPGTMTHHRLHPYVEDKQEGVRLEGG